MKQPASSPARLMSCQKMVPWCNNRGPHTSIEGRFIAPQQRRRPLDSLVLFQQLLGMICSDCSPCQSVQRLDGSGSTAAGAAGPRASPAYQSRQSIDANHADSSSASPCHMRVMDTPAEVMGPQKWHNHYSFASVVLSPVEVVTVCLSC